MFTIRKAQHKDSGAIRALIWQVRINPSGLNWRHFLVAVDEGDQVIATGQIKPHRDGSRELASIATQPDFRGQGLATAIITSLLAENPPPLYLKCAERMGTFYERFHFHVLEPAEIPPDYVRDVRFIDRLRRTVAPHIDRLLVMRLD